MKSIDQINGLLSAFEKTYDLSVLNSQQGSAEWLSMKLGVLSASNASKIVAKKDSETRATYMAELIGQVCTGIAEEINSKYLDWGNQHEDAARSSYEFMTGFKMTEIPFVFKDDSFREGCSPDGLVSDKKGAEIKCPYNSLHFIKFLTEEKIKSEYVWQYQYTLRIIEADEWDFVQYDPRMKKTMLKILTVHRDVEKQKVLNDAVPEFIYDMDQLLAKIGVKFGEQWLYGKKKLVEVSA